MSAPGEAKRGRLSRFLAGSRKRDLAFWVYLAARILSGVMNVASLKFLIDLLTRSDYGSWVYYKSVGAMLMPIVTLSVPAAMMRMYFDRAKEDREGKARLISTVFRLSLGSAALVMVASCTLYLLDLHDHWSFVYFALLMPGNLLLGYFNYLTRLRNDYILFFLNTFVSSVCTLLLLAWAVTAFGPISEQTFLTHDRLLATIGIWIACVWLVNAVNTGYYLWQGYISPRLPQLPWEEIAALVRFSAPLSGTYFLGWLLQSADLVLLGNLSTDLEVADYGLAVGIAATVAIITQSALSDWPRFYYAQMRDAHPDRDSRIAARARRFLWMHIAVMLVLRLIAGFAYDLLGADEYSAGTEYIDYLMLGNFFFLAGNLFSAGIGFVKKTHLTILTFIIPGLLNLGLNVLFIPRFGARGAALTTLVSFALFAAIAWRIGNRYYAFTERSRLAAVVAAAAVVALFPLRPLVHALGW
jgi:O-antigen/teichoic acid export membrane protein